MKQCLSLTTCVAVLIGLMTVPVSSDDGTEQIVKLADCPKAVQKTLKRESKGGKIVEIEKEEEDGETIYEAEVIIDGKEYEVEIAECGLLLSKILEELEEEDEEDEEEDDDDDDD